MGVFDFFSMMDNYEDRKIDHFEKEGLVVDTCVVTDSDQPYETAVCHPRYNDDEWIIVELYDTKKEAQEGHNKWVKKMTAKQLPNQLKDASTAEIAKLCFVVCGEEERINKRQKKEK